MYPPNILAQITVHLVLVVSPAEYWPVVSLACRPSCRALDGLRRPGVAAAGDLRLALRDRLSDLPPSSHAYTGASSASAGTRSHGSLPWQLVLPSAVAPP